MKRDLAKTRRENKQMESRLVQQEQDNGELTARLDDARNLLRERGIDSDVRAATSPEGSHDASDSGDGVRTLPAGRKRRKPPVARIPGQFTPAAPDRDQEDEGMLGPPQGASGSGSDGDQVGLRFDDDVDHHTDYNGPRKWAPIAGATGDTVSRIR
jgi:hypothetical protein